MSELMLGIARNPSVKILLHPLRKTLRTFGYFIQ
jgi:hypothetical protein